VHVQILQIKPSQHFDIALLFYIINDKNHYKIEERYQNVEKVLFEESGHAPYVEEEDKFMRVPFIRISRI
jgi:hypothetical protein